MIQISVCHLNLKLSRENYLGEFHLGFEGLQWTSSSSETLVWSCKFGPSKAPSYQFKLFYKKKTKMTANFSFVSWEMHNIKLNCQRCKQGLPTRKKGYDVKMEGGWWKMSLFLKSVYNNKGWSMSHAVAFEKGNNGHWKIF